MSILIRGGSTNAIANVDTNNNLFVNLPTSATSAGYATLMAENDNGSLSGTRLMKSPFISEERRFSVGLDTPMLSYTFNATTQDTGNWRYVTATMTTTWSVAGMLLNANSDTTSAHGTAVSSYKQFNLLGNGPLDIITNVIFTNTILNNEILEFGLFPFAAGTVAPTEGVYYRLTTAGLIGITNFNGVETPTGVLLVTSAFTINQSYQLIIRIHERLTQFFKDGVLLGFSYTPAGQGQPFITTTLPVTYQFRNSGAVTGTAAQVKILDCNVTQRDIYINKPYSAVQTGQGLIGAQGTNGNTMGTTALLSNNLAAGAGAAMTNTAASLGSGLGGQFATQPTLAVGTDGIVSSYQNPAGSINITPRTLYITGIKIQGAVTTTLASNTNGVIYAYSLAFGHTAVSLLTGEGVAAKAPRRIPLGYETYASGATAGIIGQGVAMTFNSPVVINPGEFVAVSAKNQGTATSAGVITFLVTFDSYWE